LPLSSSRSGTTSLYSSSNAGMYLIRSIAINQDPWGLPAFRINAGTNAGRDDLGFDPRLPTELQWGRHLANGDIAALVLNRLNTTATATLKFADFLPGVSGGAYHVRDVQNKKDLGAKCKSVQFALEPHGTAFVRLTKINDTCTPPAPPPAPAPHCAHWNGPCRGCSDGSKACPFPVPPLPPCPSGYTNHSSGYWSNPVQPTPGLVGKTVAQCAAACGPGCKGFEVYDPEGVTVPQSGCYTYETQLKLPFTADARGLIRTCVKS
jgi:hypothetical protein